MSVVGRRVMIIAGGRAWAGKVVEERDAEIIVETDAHGRHAVRETYLDCRQAAKRFDTSMAAVRRAVEEYNIPRRRVRRWTYYETGALAKALEGEK